MNSRFATLLSHLGKRLRAKANSSSCLTSKPTSSGGSPRELMPWLQIALRLVLWLAYVPQEVGQEHPTAHDAQCPLRCIPLLLRGVSGLWPQGHALGHGNLLLWPRGRARTTSSACRLHSDLLLQRFNVSGIIYRNLVLRTKPPPTPQTLPAFVNGIRRTMNAKRAIVARMVQLYETQQPAS